jgi:signal peptidase II
MTKAKNLWFWVAAVSMFALDAVSKQWIIHSLAVGETVPLWPRVFHLTHVRNTGAAFSLFDGGSEWLKWISLIVSIGLVVYSLVSPRISVLEQWGYGFILGGALGNGLDRFSTGRVVDFLDFRLIHFAVFNLADVSINLGIACLLLSAWFGSKNSSKRSYRAGP